MKFIAESTSTKVILSLYDPLVSTFRLERKKNSENEWKVYVGGGFVPVSELTEPGEKLPDSEETTEEITPFAVPNGDFLDNFDLTEGLYEYRCCNFELETITDKDYAYTPYIRIGAHGGIGYTFNNYRAPEGSWGTIVTPDDCRYTYLWGTDFKATNGQSFSDEQIQYFINAATESIGRTLGIDIKKTKYRYDPKARNLEKGKDYDIEESLYDYHLSRIQKYGVIKTRHKPIIQVTKLDLLSRYNFDKIIDLLPTTVIDKQKGLLKMIERPIRPSETVSGIETAISMYGNKTYNGHLFYAIDYDAGYETSDDVPADLREIVGKQAAIGLLNVIGDGLMSGFSSSSLSMDGVSESFSSTQSATSAYFGARIAEYKKDIDTYIKENRYRFSNMAIGCL